MAWCLASLGAGLGQRLSLQTVDWCCTGRAAPDKRPTSYTPPPRDRPLDPSRAAAYKTESRGHGTRSRWDPARYRARSRQLRPTHARPTPETSVNRERRCRCCCCSSSPPRPTPGAVQLISIACFAPAPRRGRRCSRTRVPRGKRGSSMGRTKSLDERMRIRAVESLGIFDHGLTRRQMKSCRCRGTLARCFHAPPPACPSLPQALMHHSTFVRMASVASSTSRVWPTLPPISLITLP